MKKYEKYKDSGVDWIGEIPEGWEVRKLKFFSYITMGQSPDSHSVNEKYGTPFFQGKAEFGDLYPIAKNYCTSPKKVALENDILISVRAPVGDLNIANVDCCIGRGLASIRYKNNKYIYYLMKSSYFFLNGFNKGSTFEAIDISNLKNIPIPFIYIEEEQKKISTFLDKKTEAIENFIKNKQKLIIFLEEEKKTIITNSVTKGINPNVNYKSSGVEWIGDIPEHWEVRRTKYIFDLIVEPAKKNNDYELLSIYTDIGVKPRKDLAEKGNKASTTDGYWKVKKGDFIVNKLLAWMGAIGLSEYEGVTSPAYDILRKNIELDEQFYNYIFRCGVLLTEIKRYSKGIMEMRLRLYFSEFGNIPLVYPPLEEQQKIVTYIDQESKKIDNLKEKYQKEIDLIKEYKERLIYDVVTGKMNVQDYEIH